LNIDNNFNQINKEYIYNIDDTTIYNYIKSIQYNKDIENILTINNNKEPNNFKQAMDSDEKDEWYKACLEENNELLKQNTYEIIDIPDNITPIKGRWVFKRKPINANSYKESYITNKDKNIRYKARWVIQGFNQKLGIDYLETFSTTCRTETWHLLLIIAVNKGWHIRQFDIKNAFVHADIDTIIYCILPIGLYEDPKYKNKCCKLNKALYGLKQAPRLWNLFFRNIIKKYGFEVLPHDEGIYINKETCAILIVHVDDIIFIHADLSYIKNTTNKLNKEIKIQDMGNISTFLGNNISIDYINKIININQKDYTTKLLNKFNIFNTMKPKKIPGQPGIKPYKNNKITDNKITALYQSEIGSLLYLSLKTRPDITFNVNLGARFMSNPSQEHIKLIQNIWQYLLYTINTGIIYECSGSDLYLKGYSDSDWAGDINSRKSTSGYIFSLSPDLAINNPISWNSLLQKSVALSSCEAEYMAIKEAVKEAIYLSNIFNYLNDNLKLGYTKCIPKIMVDSEPAIKLSENPEFHKRSKHIDIAYHFIRESVQENKIKILHIPGTKNLADLLTKSLEAPIFERLRDLGNINIT